MTSEMQRDIERIEPLIPFDPETREAWQRIRQRLTPEREWVARAICVACGENPEHTGDAQGNEKRWQDYLDVADAAINAMGEP